jgi:hypothetical protein
MARRSRLYVALDVDFFDNPKILEAGEPATMLYLRGLALCKRQWSTDGLIFENQLRTFRLRGVHDRAAKLTELGLWVHEDGGYRVAGWLERNKSAAQLDLISQERADAGSRGGVASGQVRGGQAKQSASKDGARWSDPSKQVENECEPNSESSQVRDNSSSSLSPPVVAKVAEEAFQLIARQRLEHRRGVPINNERAWIAKVMKDLRLEHCERALKIVAEQPSIAPLRLAHLLEPEKTSDTSWMTRGFPTCPRCLESIVPPDAERSSDDGLIHADCQYREAFPSPVGASC